ncbi:hypothetical protein TcasGA2_TC015737 [Tribolium castaneum]|uniref:Uncharacterized protein n=1 Tax=Tribolium castaneum TaxID=7070 RepID=D2A3R1_TRICA|nr:hypothetical protein TcasGA2_TC015737 [Tribolium castaneum]
MGLVFKIILLVFFIKLSYQNPSVNKLQTLKRQDLATCWWFFPRYIYVNVVTPATTTTEESIEEETDEDDLLRLRRRRNRKKLKNRRKPKKRKNNTKN